MPTELRRNVITTVVCNKNENTDTYYCSQKCRYYTEIDYQDEYWKPTCKTARCELYNKEQEREDNLPYGSPLCLPDCILRFEMEDRGNNG